MKDKYLGKDGIIEKYNFREQIINYFKIAGTVGGGVYTLISLGPDSVGKILIGGGVSTFSYFIGDSLNKLNESRKKKAIKSLEERTLRA